MTYDTSDLEEAKEHMLKTCHPAVIMLALTGAAQADQIAIDGQFDDWSTVPVVLVDPADATNAEVDFGQIKISHDDERVQLLVDLGREVTVQRLDGRVLLIFDADGDPDTGQTVHGLGGADLIVELSPRNPRRPTGPGMGLGIRPLGDQPADPTSSVMSPYEVNLMMGPTCADSQFEFQLDRGGRVLPAPTLLDGDAFSIKLVALDAKNKMTDQTDPVTYQLDDRGSSAPGQTADPLARPAGTALRVMSWNAERGSIFQRAAPYLRIIATLKPDVILFQELSERNSAAQLQSLLEQTRTTDQNEHWNVLLGSGGGNLRCAIASRKPLKPVDALALVPVPGQPDRSIRVVGGAVEVDGRHLLLASCHLKCCGSLGSREDVIRRNEVGQIRKAVAAAMKDGNYDAVIVGGDMNLVGSCQILETLVGGLDLDGTALEPCPAYQLNGRSTATWTDAGQPFIPGRLDYLLYSDSAIQLLDTFVFQTDDLSAQWIDGHGLRADDSRCSDHLPVVADLRFTGKNR